jgi:short-subunit dehydrogenase
MNLILVARRKSLLEGVAGECGRSFGVEARILEADLGSADFVGRLEAAVSGLELGVIVYNAAFAPVGEFAATDGADLLRAVDVNVRGPVALLRALLPPMISRGRGAAILMSSLAGNQGAPRLATYAATKAFNRVLAEGLWRELEGRGVDIVACCAGAIRTPGYAIASGREAPGTLEPEAVAEKAIRALGRGPLVVPGLVNRLAAALLGRLLPRRAAIGIMAGQAKGLGRARESKASA